MKSMEWEKSVERKEEECSLDLAYILRSLREEIRSCKVDNNRLIDAQERHAKDK